MDPSENLQKLGAPEKALVAILFVLAVGVYTYWIDQRVVITLGDTAILAQLADRMAETGRPLTQAAQAVKHLYTDYSPPILMTDAAVLCKLELTGPGPEEFNFFLWHTYIGLYAFLPLFMLLGGELALSLLIAVSFLMVVFGGYVVLRKHGVALVLAALVAVLLMLHPVWTGGVVGPFYAERLFVGPGFVLCALLLARRFDSVWLYPLALFLALTSERAGLIVGALLIGAVFLSDPLRPGEWWKHRYVVALGVLCVVLSTLLIRFFIGHPHYGSFLGSFGIQEFWRNWTSYPNFAANLTRFLVINIVAWGVPALGYWRGFVLALGAMVPNIFGNYGGGEKGAFTIHYHSFYFPVLAAAVFFSVGHVYKHHARWAGWLAAAWLCIAGLAYNFDANEYDFRFADWNSRSFSYPFRNYDAERPSIAQRRELRAYMDQFPGSTISTTEPLMATFYQHHNIAYYPLGIDDSDFVVIPKAGDAYGGMFSYLGGEENARIDECLRPRLDAKYHVQKDFDSIVVLARNK